MGYHFGMAVRFVIGRAGAGKTAHCLASVRQHLKTSAESDERLILLVPEQASLQTERALLSHPDVGATHRAEVLSFQRLAFRILQRGGVARRRALSSVGRALVLRHLLGELHSRLTLYRRTERCPGLVQELARAVSEFLAEAVEPDALDGSRAIDARDPLLRHKLDDLRILYAAYLAFLGDDKLDPSLSLALAREHLDQWPELSSARVWVDGFAGFTGQQRRLLVELGRRVRGMEVTVMADPEYAVRAGDAVPIEPTDQFGKIQRMHLELRADFAAAGVDVIAPLLLRPDPLPRFARRPALARLERLFFAEGDAAPSGASRDVTLVTASDRRAEADYVASLICHLVREGRGAIRYRDIAVILRDMGPYHDLLSALLAERRIPFFIDRRRPTSHHPAVELLRGLIAMVERPFRLSAMRLLLKTGMLGIDDAAADALENYLLACGLEGPEIWRQAQSWHAPGTSPLDRPDDALSPAAAERLNRIDRARRAVVERLAAWYDAAASGACTGAEWARRLKDALDSLKAADRLAQWADRADADGNLDLAEEHRQITRDIAGFLDDLCASLGDERMDVSRLGEVVEAGLSELTLGLAPPMLDQVLVGSIERSRHPEIKIAIVMGFNEGSFPHVGSEDAILNDEDRDWLREQGVQVGVTRRQRALEESLLAYTALTRASDRAYVTYALADADGQALRPSPYVVALRQACPDLRELHVDDGFRSRRTWNVWTSRDLAGRLAFEFRHRPAVAAEADADTRELWNDVYEAARRAEDLQRPLAKVLAALAYRNDARLSGAVTRRLVKEPLLASVSRLEMFAACPFQHFASYGLRLEERKEAALAAVDVGTIHHAILEEFVREVASRGQSLGALDDATMWDLLESGRATVEATVREAGTELGPRDLYMLRRSAADLRRVLGGQRRAARAGRFRPRAAELAFGLNEPGSLPALDIVTPKGRKARLRGFIDRVDLAELADETLGVVIDYKRTRDKRLDLSSVYHGLSLQLPGYLLVLADRGRTLGGRAIQPAAAFYVSLIETYRAVDHPSDAEEADADAAGVFAPRGVLNMDRMEALDAGFAGSGRSEVYHAARKRDGGIARVDASDAVEADDFRRLLEHTRRRLGEWADGVLDGEVAVRPYRMGDFSPCGWCKYAAVCRFESGRTPVRDLPALKRSEVFDRLRAAAAPAGGG